MTAMQRLLAVGIVLGTLLSSASAEPAIWVVKGPHATVYLFGTIHVLRKDTVWRSPAIDKAIHDSKDLWLELLDDDQAALQPIVQQLGMDPEHPLRTKLTNDQIIRLDNAAKAAGIPAGATTLQTMRPWLVAVSLSIVPMLQAGYDPNSGVDKIIRAEFAHDGKSLHSFETASQQLHFFSDLPAKTEVEFLDSALKDIAEGPDRFDRLVASWANGDVEKLAQLEDEDMRQKYPELYSVLVVKRNQAWAARIAELAKGEGTSLIAVGAAHFAGPDGVPTMLEKLGLKVERLPAAQITTKPAN